MEKEVYVQHNVLLIKVQIIIGKKYSILKKNK